MTDNRQRAAALWDHIGDGHSFFEGEGVIAAALDEAEQRGRAEALREAAKPDCPLSERVDGPLHSWRFDGDDPYVTCVYCDQMQDARTGRVIRQGRTTDDLPPAPDVSQMRVTFDVPPRPARRVVDYCWRCDQPPTATGDPALCDREMPASAATWLIGRPLATRRHRRLRPSGLSGAFGCCGRTRPL